MTSVFGNVFRMSGGGSVWGNVFVLEDAAQPVDGWIAQAKTRHFVAASQNRVLIPRPQGRIWTARSSNE